jgi:hypothetical protein
VEELGIKTALFSMLYVDPSNGRHRVACGRRGALAGCIFSKVLV